MIVHYIEYSLSYSTEDQRTVTTPDWCTVQLYHQSTSQDQCTVQLYYSYI